MSKSKCRCYNYCNTCYPVKTNCCGGSSSPCNFSSLVILILIIFQFSNGKGCSATCGKGNNGILFIIALFFLSCCTPSNSNNTVCCC